MENKDLKSFNTISNIIDDGLKNLSFARLPLENTQNEISIIFQKEALAYRILFEKEKTIYSLSSCVISQDDDTNDCYDNWKQIVTWLFDPGVNTTKDAEDIGKDFLRTIAGEKQKKLAKNTKKKKKSDESNADPIFFFNRLVNVFPDLKAEINFEKNNYETFRSVTFTKENVLPKVHNILTLGEKARVKKLGSIFSNMYSAGDLDTKSIITYVILNDITNTEQIKMMEEFLSEDLIKSWGFSKKLIGKNIKPEKVKKKKSFMADTLAGR